MTLAAVCGMTQVWIWSGQGETLFKGEINITALTLKYLFEEGKTEF